jgi:hypothetical protein
MGDFEKMAHGLTDRQYAAMVEMNEAFGNSADTLSFVVTSAMLQFMDLTNCHHVEWQWEGDEPGNRMRVTGVMRCPITNAWCAKASGRKCRAKGKGKKRGNS